VLNAESFDRAQSFYRQAVARDPNFALGFPIALIIAWAFEVTPEGLKRTEVADREPTKPSRNRAWIHIRPRGFCFYMRKEILKLYTACDASSQSAIPRTPYQYGKDIK